MTNIKKWIDEFLKKHKLTWKDIQKVHLGDKGWDYGNENNKPIILNAKEARKVLNYEFDSGYGGEEGHSFYIYLKDWILVKGCYDGSEWMEEIPRKTNKKIKPKSIGGG